MRELTSHKVNGANETLKIEVMDEPGSGGACHRYDITGFDTDNNPSAGAGQWGKAAFSRAIILFQNGPIGEAGVNGVTHEALLAILEDRLAGFQTGPFACEENRIALGFIRQAQSTLKSRTQKRLARGVEGTHTV